MTIFLIFLLAVVCLAGYVQTYRAQHYQNLYNSSEVRVKNTMSLVWWQERRIQVLQDALHSIDAKQIVLSDHPKLSAKHLRCILNSHLKRQYRGGLHYTDRGFACSLMGAAQKRRKYVYKHGKERPDNVQLHLQRARESHANIRQYLTTGTFSTTHATV